MHLRKDVTESLLLEGRLRSIRLDGTSVVANPNYVWHRARGPAWLRPPRYGDCWYPYMSQGFGPFETMALAEKAGLEFVTIGINIRAETPETAADMMDCKLSGDHLPFWFCHPCLRDRCPQTRLPLHTQRRWPSSARATGMLSRTHRL